MLATIDTSRLSWKVSYDVSEEYAQRMVEYWRSIAVMGIVKRPTAIDLFAGVGGLSLGLEAAGFDIAASIEMDPIHCAVHKFNFPDTEIICADISTLNYETIVDALRARGIESIDLIVGGPPCQGFSQIGQRQLDDPRNALVNDYCRIVRKLKPKYFIFENVPGIISGKHRAFVTELTRELSSDSYNVVEPRILDASDYGVAQFRKRFIAMGYRTDVRPVTYPAGGHCNADALQSALLENVSTNIGAREAIADLEDIQVYFDQDKGIPCNELSYMGYRQRFSFEFQGGYELCHRRENGKMKLVFGHRGSKHTATSIQRFGETQPGSTEPISRFFKLDPERPCNTIRAGTASDRGSYTAPRPIHYEKPRCISIREAARLQSFPDWFRFHDTIWHGFRQVGNSVAPLFAKALAGEVIKALGIETSHLEIRDLSGCSTDLLGMNMSKACELFGVQDGMPKRRRIMCSANTTE